jgi:hypothetical protein
MDQSIPAEHSSARTSSLMVKPTCTLDLAINGRLERLSWRHNPIDYGSLQPLRIIGMSGIDVFLYLLKALVLKLRREVVLTSSATCWAYSSDVFKSLSSKPGQRLSKSKKTLYSRISLIQSKSRHHGQ